MNKKNRILALIIVVLISYISFNAINTSNIQTVKNVDENYRIKALKLPANLNLAGERVPIEMADIRERMDRELLVNTYWQSNGLLLIKRANKYFPVLEPLLKKYGLPDDFKYLAVAESGLTDETSSAGAAGMWHFMKGTGKEYGLEINDNVDERYNIELSTKVAAQYLKEAKEKFGTWTLAAASYNAGQYGVARYLDMQEVDSYYDALLPDETERYIFRIVALKEILSNPKKYGFIYDEKDLYIMPKTKTVQVDTVITNIAQFAKGFNTNYKELKLHNSWLRENKLNNASRKLYEIKIPLK